MRARPERLLFGPLLLGLPIAAIAAVPIPPVELPAPRVLSAPRSSFDPERDIFAFGNGLRWEYDSSFTELAVPIPRDQDEYDHRCSQMVRAARQFFYAVRFAPEQARVSDESYRKLIRAVMKSDARATEPLDPPIVIPGFADLREFSEAYERSVKDEIGGPWRAYFQRGNWRMIFGFPPEHQRDTARSMLAELAEGNLPVVHLIHFPRVTINHTLLVYRAAETTTSIDFVAYDPNHRDREIFLRYDRAEAEFDLDPTLYWPGGPVVTYEVFHGWLY